MSNRALKKLTSENPSFVEENLSSFSEEEDEKNDISSAANRFQFLDNDENGDAGDSDSSKNEVLNVKKPKNKKKKRKLKLKPPENVEKVDDSTSNLDSNFKENDATLPEKNLFAIEYRNLNMENELKRIFGGVVGRQMRPAAATNRRTVAGGRLVRTKLDARIAKTGLSMVLVREISSGGVNLFKFEHNAVYQNAQKLFWEAADALNPELFVAILKQHPFHLDTLIQMSEIYRLNEDFGTARDLIEKAISACQAAFHPLFNVAANNSRLDYRQRENRSFFLALHKHMLYITQKVCYRTALEFCKLIFSFDQEDPLGVLLFMDYFCLRCKQYDYLINLYYLLEGERNLSQLPNFCFSVALAHYFKAVMSDEQDFKEADSKLQEALRKFPTFLPILLEKCQVEPDGQVAKEDFFSHRERSNDGQGLKILYEIYARRTQNLWKENRVLNFLERNVRKMVENGQFKSENVIFEEFKNNRKLRYKIVPENVIRHVILGGEEMQTLLSYLPSGRNFNAYDPAPPSDGIYAYERPNLGPNPQNRRDDSVLGSFLRSLMPNYDPEAEPPQQANGNDFQQSVQGVLRAMRDLLADIQVAAPDRENVEQENNDNWDDDNQFD